MKNTEVKENIGRRVTINGARDLAMDAYLKTLVFDKHGVFDVRINKLTKAGMVEIIIDGKCRYSVPPRNVDLWIEK